MSWVLAGVRWVDVSWWRTARRQFGDGVQVARAVVSRSGVTEFSLLRGSSCGKAVRRTESGLKCVVASRRSTLLRREETIVHEVVGIEEDEGGKKRMAIRMEGWEINT
jgi:hypothetical protein